MCTHATKYEVSKKWRSSPFNAPIAIQTKHEVVTSVPQLAKPFLRKALFPRLPCFSKTFITATNAHGRSITTCHLRSDIANTKKGNRMKMICKMMGKRLMGTMKWWEKVKEGSAVASKLTGMTKNILKGKAA